MNNVYIGNYIHNSDPRYVLYVTNPDGEYLSAARAPLEQFAGILLCSIPGNNIINGIPTRLILHDRVRDRQDPWPKKISPLNNKHLEELVRKMVDVAERLGDVHLEQVKKVQIEPAKK